MQSYLSFIGGQCELSTLQSLLPFLPNDSPTAISLNLKDFNFIVHPSDHPLFQFHYSKNQNTLFVIQGFFYEGIDIEKFNKIISPDANSQSRINFLNTLNGNFNGFYLDTQSNEISFFTDNLGFEKIYHTTEENLLFSSFIWPLIKSGDVKIDETALGEHLFLGHSLETKTIFSNIKTIIPGCIKTIYLTANKTTSVDFYKNETVLTGSISKLKEAFFEDSKRLLNYVSLKTDTTKWGMTLTGGNDTRVVLNSILNSGYKPFCIAGYDRTPGTDALRSEKIAKHFGLKSSTLDYSEGYESIIKDTVLISNGYTNGIWMGNLSSKIDLPLDSMYYGFSGDLVSGGNEFDFSSMSIEEIAQNSLIYKSYYKNLDFYQISSLVGASSDQFYQTYLNTYTKFKEYPIAELYFLQEKNERNARRIASFADGTKLGPPPVSFFHDRRIFDFYRSVNQKLHKDQFLHHKLSFYKNPFLAWMPSANKTNLPSFTIPYISKVLSTENINRITRILKKEQPGIKISSMRMLFDFFDKGTILHSSVKEYNILDWSNFFESIKDSQLKLQDLNTLKMRLWDILLTIELIKSPKLFPIAKMKEG